MFQLDLLGGARISGPAGPLAGRVSQRRQLALLAYLALQDRPVTRDRLLSVFWPENDSERARHALSDAVYVLRKALGEDAVRSLGDDLVLNTALVRSDVGAFAQALAGRRVEAAVELYAGPFLDGFHLGDAPAFEAWQQTQRDRLAQDCLAAAEAAATTRQAEGDRTGALIWWRRAAALEPHNSRIALRLTRALADAGDLAGAIRFVDAHTRLVEEEYGITPPAELAAYAAGLRRADMSWPEHTDHDAESVNGSSAAIVKSLPDPAPASVGTAQEPDATASLSTVGLAASPPRPGATGRRPWRFALFGVVVLAVFGVALRWNSVRSAAGEAIDPGVVVVLPFRAAGLHPDLAYLGEGMVDMVAAKLTGEAGGLRALPPSHVLAARGGALQADLDDLAPDAAHALARQLGAAALLLGSLVGERSNLTIQATLVDARTGREIARAGVRGTEPELHDLVDRLIGQILSRTAHEEEHRLAHLTSTSLPALRVFLSARVAHRRGDYETALRQYGQALELDSTFALAGLGAVAVSGWVGGSTPIAQRGGAVARAYHHRLSERDRVGLFGRLEVNRVALATAPLVIAEVEEALRRFPDHARLWYMRGDLFLHYGIALGFDAWATRARESFERAIEIDADYAEPVHHLATILNLIGDTAALRDLADQQLARVPDGPVADYLRWLARHSVGPPFREPPLHSMHTDATLRWIGIVAQDYGLATSQGAAAVQLRLDRPGIRDEHFERRMGALAWALNTDRTAEAASALHSLHSVQPDPDFHHRIAILTALFAENDDSTAAASARELTASTARKMIGELNRCVLTLWQLRHAPAAVPRPRILSDEVAFSADTAEWPLARRMCALVRDAQWLARSGGAEWHTAIDRLERLLHTVPTRPLVDDGHVEYVHVALARLHDAAGSPRAALDALRRRSYYHGWQPYLATSLREEVRLATALGDTSTERRARLHYHAMRAGTDASASLVNRPHKRQVP